MKKYNIEPKRLQLVYPRYGSECNMILIEGAKNGNSSLKILPPLYVHDKDGNYLSSSLRGKVKNRAKNEAFYRILDDKLSELDGDVNLDIDPDIEM